VYEKLVGLRGERGPRGDSCVQTGRSAPKAKPVEKVSRSQKSHCRRVKKPLGRRKGENVPGTKGGNVAKCVCNENVASRIPQSKEWENREARQNESQCVPTLSLRVLKPPS